MLFKDLRTLDKYGAFKDFCTVEEAEKSKQIPSSFHGVFPKKCSCGSDMIISSNNKTLMCCNPRCKIKIAEMLAETFTRYECKFIKSNTCLSIMTEAWNNLKFKSHIEILKEGTEMYIPTLFGNKGVDFKVAINKIKNSKNTLGTTVSRLGFPALNEISTKIFDGYNTLDEFEKDLNEQGIYAFLESRNIYDKQVYFYLDYFMEDIRLAVSWLGTSVSHNAIKTQQICLSGSLVVNGEVLHKKQYLDLLNQVGTTSDGIWVFEFKDSKARMSVPFIIAEKGQNSASVKAAISREINNKYALLKKCKSENREPTRFELVQCRVLYTGQEFYNLVKGGTEVYERQRA